MRAIVLEKFGGLDSLVYKDIPEPEHGRLTRPFIKLGAAIHDRTAAGWTRVQRWYRAADRRSPIDLKIIGVVLALAVIAGVVVLTSGFGLYGEDEGGGGKGKQAPAPEEIEVAKLAGQVYLRFKQLPQAHPADLGEVAFHVHAIGRIVFARAAIRAHPEHWTFK